ncbi:MAG TPA: polysaccharide deacetylase family protein, partial [Elusimicrobiota bacterium]|nr:polysaccharide deacetylase family protein [Elusimicrobiota bacterium]
MKVPSRLNSLMYHDILTSGSGSRYSFSLGEFRRHLRDIEARVGGAPAIAGRENEASRFALTFDDGCAGWLAAGEELNERRWPAHFFVITGVIGRPGRLARRDIRRLARMGHVIGSHTVDHPSHFS